MALGTTISRLNKYSGQLGTNTQRRITCSVRQPASVTVRSSPTDFVTWGKIAVCKALCCAKHPESSLAGMHDADR